MIFEIKKSDQNDHRSSYNCFAVKQPSVERIYRLIKIEYFDRTINEVNASNCQPSINSVHSQIIVYVNVKF